ncbi:DUF1152 domain-containing protein [Nocardia sp. NPDC058058]|uniref:DUF1152 domain-containing protein n=1 Tax=Nocardia sp. NPDC058058 TaxID=3346317 RepID=UPI0036DA4EF9
MSGTLAVAAGGGGDAVTAAVIASAMAELGVSAILTYSWDRLMIDPTPGPRSVADFDGLVIHSRSVAQVPATASLRTGSRSTIPRLAQHLSLPLLLMDISNGAPGLASQIRAAAEVFGADSVVVIDVGGDILAEGHETSLRSPLADSLALAASVISRLPVRVLVAGVGLDGELTDTELQNRLARLDAQPVRILAPSDVLAYEGVWEWHPSEANGLLAVAASGWRGQVETQRDAVIRISDNSAVVYEVCTAGLYESSLASRLSVLQSLAEVERLLRQVRGYSDIDIERRRLQTRPEARQPTEGALDLIDRYAADAAARSIDALTIRRVAELVHATDPEAVEALRVSLMRMRPSQFRPPLYLTRPQVPINRSSPTDAV